MRRGTILGLALGTVGAIAGWLHAVPALGPKVSAWASAAPPEALANSGPAVLGLLLASVGVWIGARRAYSERQQRRVYVTLCVGLLALVVLPHALFRMLGEQAWSSVPGSLSALGGVLALGALLLVGFMSRLYPPKRTAP
jgi:hypothetical protein